MKLKSNMYIGILNTAGVIFALGHFYFAYKYYFLKNGTLKTTALLLVSIFCCLIIFFTLKYVSNVNPGPLFNSLVIFLFTLHHCFDSYKFKYYKSAVLWLLYGLTLTMLFVATESNYYKGVVYSLIWLMVFHHYFYWIYLSFRGLANKKSFIVDVIVSHLVIAALFTVNHFYLRSSHLDLLYSLSVFYFLTLVHVVFSFLKDLCHLYDK